MYKNVYHSQVNECIGLPDSETEGCLIFFSTSCCSSARSMHSWHCILDYKFCVRQNYLHSKNEETEHSVQKERGNIEQEVYKNEEVGIVSSVNLFT